MRPLFVLTIVFLTALPLSAQEKKDTKAGDTMIEKYLAAEADKLSQKYLDGAKTIEEWKQKRPRQYQEYMDMLGLWPLPEKTPLKATKTGEVEAHGVVVENIHFQSKPGLYVTANVYRPKTPPAPPSKGGEKSDSPSSQGGAKSSSLPYEGGVRGGRLPAIVYVCGHSFKGRDGNKSAHQDHGFWYANNGYVCIVLDSLQLGEIPGVHHGTYGQPWRHAASYGMKKKDKLENRFWWYSLGYSPAAVECWNGIRAIDYLLTRPDVDPERIGVTGISGGGAATFWIAAADERVKVAVPVSGMSDLESYVKNKVINGHCDCMFLYNTYQWDWTTIAALVAPRPLLFANSDNDPIFPMDGNRRIIEKLRKIYTMYDKPNLVDDYISSGGHAYRPDLRIAVFKFLNKHLKGDTTTPVEDCTKYTPLEGRKLRAFPEEKDLPKDAINERADEFFIPQAKVKLPEKGKFEEWKKGMVARIRDQCFHVFPREIDPGETLNDPALRVMTEPGIKVGTTFLGGERKDLQTIVFQIIPDHEVAARITQNRGDFIDKEVKKMIADGRTIGGFLRGTYEFHWSKKSPPNFVERSHALLGRTVAQGRVRDVISLVRNIEGILKKEDKKSVEWKVLGVSEDGIIAAYAALFEPSIKEVIVIDPPKSHKEGPYFLNVLRVLDIPEALGLLAPTPLTIIGGNDPAFDRTAEIYRLAGAGDKLTRK